MTHYIKGFSKLSKEEKQSTTITEAQLDLKALETLHSFTPQSDPQLFDNLSENTISGYTLPFGIAPNFLINNTFYMVPMVTEESSVVAAASKAASFWSQHGGFTTTIVDIKKSGQIFFKAQKDFNELTQLIKANEQLLRNSSAEHTANMEKRGGGILQFQLLELDFLKNGYELRIHFNTMDSMGANFINTCLETIGRALIQLLESCTIEASLIMAILSNYTPECRVKSILSCPIDELKAISGELSPEEFAMRFEEAILIAKHNTYRATTHNKGIMNGIDAVIIATGNDFRAIEAGLHAYAAHSGKYQSLTDVQIVNKQFTFSIEIPLSLGTVGGLTNLHPLAKLALDILGNPSAKDLMSITASTGLASNFMAVTSLITSGIQKGHMKLHLSNILAKFNCTTKEIQRASKHFEKNTVSYLTVKNFIDNQREST